MDNENVDCIWCLSTGRYNNKKCPKCHGLTKKELKRRKKVALHTFYSFIIVVVLITPLFIMYSWISSLGEVIPLNDVDPSEIIISANHLTFGNLNKDQKADLHLNYQDSVCFISAWNNKKECVGIDDSYYVKIEVNKKLLAKVVSKIDHCIDEKVSFDRMMGKYCANWDVRDDLGEKLEFNQYNRVVLEETSSHAKIILGPFLDKPKMVYVTRLDRAYEHLEIYELVM